MIYYDRLRRFKPMHPSSPAKLLMFQEEVEEDDKYSFMRKKKVKMNDYNDDGYGECYMMLVRVEVGRVCVTGLIGSLFRCDVSLRWQSC